MARTTITPTTPAGPYPTLPAAALSLNLAWVAADIVNQNQVSGSGPKIILAWNTHASTGYTVTLTSIADRRGRTGTITAYALAAATIMAFKINEFDGWLQSDNNIYFEANNASVVFCVLNL